jgi:MFS superfamily sulfate permease-like transporter
MRSIGAFCISTWLAAAVLVLGRHSVPMMALSGVIVFAGLDLFRPGSGDQ